MAMRMLAVDRRVMRVIVMAVVVAMRVLVLGRIVGMLVAVLFRDVQVHADAKASGSEQRQH